MPVIRVDDEIWRWLKELAEPFEDTPNSVLRRVAHLPAESAAKPIAKATRLGLRTKAKRDSDAVPGSVSSESRVTGDLLNRRHGLGARHALYHKDGTFYERLARFPGVLCDPNGYVRYSSEQQFLADAQLKIGEKVNIPRALASHPRYTRFTRRS